MRDRSVQRDGLAEREDVESVLRSVRADYIREGAPESIRWIFFRSPDSTWENLCGREGWLLVDEESRRQFNFLETAMN